MLYSVASRRLSASFISAGQKGGVVKFSHFLSMAKINGSFQEWEEPQKIVANGGPIAPYVLL
jgi:hypothetical protein